MEKKILILVIFATFSEIGYSLLAPLFPFLALERNITDTTVGWIFSSFAISNLIGTLSTPTLVKKLGRKNILSVSIIIEGLCTCSFGLISFISNPLLFTFLSFLIRVTQGFGSAICGTLVYSLTAAISEEEYIQKNIGFIELGCSIGVGIGPLIASIGYYFFGFEFPFLLCGLLEILSLSWIPELEIKETESENEAEPNILHILKNVYIWFTFIAVIVDMISLSFIYPVFATHISLVYNLPPEQTSLLFIVETLVYLISIQYLDRLNNYLGNRVGILLGTVWNGIFILLIAPTRFAPQSLWVILIGLGGLGLSGAWVSIPAMVDLINTMKENWDLEENTAQDYSSAIFNLGFFLGETMGPLMGGFLTNNYGFERACNYNSLFNFMFSFLYFCFIVYAIRNHDSNSNMKIGYTAWISDTNKDIN